MMTKNRATIFLMGIPGMDGWRGQGAARESMTRILADGIIPFGSCHGYRKMGIQLFAQPLQRRSSYRL
jgi:hypothetical protein